ncbi:MAG: MBL fold metallo-hydrolase [Clostridiales bacterium]|nr:MBL fold metallo-hydrolase [Clostridiales bacterium]
MKVLSLTVGPIMTNCYVLCDEAEKVCFLIDPGDEADRVEQLVASSGCELKAILLTHGHFDHCTGVAGILLNHPELPVYINFKDSAEHKSGSFYMQFPQLPEKNQRYYGEGDQLTLGSLTVTVMETPGHSAGSVCLVVDDVIFSGDTLFRLSCGRTDLAGGSYSDMLRSLGRLGRLEGDYRVYPGHEAATTLADERSGNPYMQQGMQRV